MKAQLKDGTSFSHTDIPKNYNQLLNERFTVTVYKCTFSF